MDVVGTYWKCVNKVPTYLLSKKTRDPTSGNILFIIHVWKLFQFCGIAHTSQYSGYNYTEN